MKLVRIASPHFVAGLETDGVVRRAAPIIAYMIGWKDERVRNYVKKMGWVATVVEEFQASTSKTTSSR